MRLAFAGSCKSCPSSAVTLELAVEDAVRAAAPEISSIEVVTANAASVIPAESLMAQVKSNARRAGIRCPRWPSWRPARSAASWSAGPRCWRAGSTTRLFAYRDHCPVCDDSLAGRAHLHDALLRLPALSTRISTSCTRAPARTAAHLDPLPLLPRDGVLSVALPAEAGGGRRMTSPV